MKAAAQEYAEWLARYNAKNKAGYIAPESSKIGTDELRGITVTDGLRRGYNGKRPRLNRALSDCICTRADGSQYIMGKKTANKITTAKHIAANSIANPNLHLGSIHTN